MPPSHVRKEEAELRQIAKQSRTARKEAQERERKQRQRALRAAAKSGAEGAAAADADAASTGAGAAAAKKKRGAIIMPDEVQEMRQRLLGEDATAATDAGAKKTSNKKAQRASGKKANGASAATAAAAATSGAPSAATSSSFLVPSFHQEVHFKKMMFFVDVVLHHVPHQKINVSETTNQQLVVDTSAFTKKYRLVLPFPDGMRCDAAAANYDFEHGVLSCKLPILDGTLPTNLTESNEKMVEQMRQQRALRFRVSQDGDLTVRTRQALLAPTPEAQAALQQAAKEAKKKDGEGEEKEGEASGKSKKRAREAAEEDAKPTKAVKKAGKAAAADGAAAAAAAAAAVATAAKPAKQDIFQAEHTKAMEAAKAAADKVHLSMREKMQLAKTVQASRQERLQTRSERKERKEEQKQSSFQRVIEEQKRRLMAQATMQLPAKPAPRANAKADGASKSVRFAES